MNFLTKLFKKKPMVEIPPRPSWETVVEMMYDKHLDAFSDEVVIDHFQSNRQKRYKYRRQYTFGIQTYLTYTTFSRSFTTKIIF